MGIALVFASIMALVALMVFFYNRAVKEACGGDDGMATWCKEAKVARLVVVTFYTMKIQAARRVVSTYVNRMMLSCGLTPKTYHVRIALDAIKEFKRGNVSWPEYLMWFVIQPSKEVFENQIWVERVIRRGDVVMLWPGTWCTFDGKRVAWTEWHSGWEFGFVDVANWPCGNSEGVQREYLIKDCKAADLFEGLAKAKKLGIERTLGWPIC